MSVLQWEKLEKFQDISADILSSIADEATSNKVKILLDIAEKNIENHIDYTNARVLLLAPRQIHSSNETQWDENKSDKISRKILWSLHENLIKLWNIFPGIIFHFGGNEYANTDIHFSALGDIMATLKTSDHFIFWDEAEVPEGYELVSGVPSISTMWPHKGSYHCSIWMPTWSDIPQQTCEDMNADFIYSLDKLVNSRYREQAPKTSSMTWLPNKASFDDRWKMLLEIAKNQNIPITTCMMDADHFSEINNDFGHLWWDIVIQAIASICKDVFATIPPCFIGGMKVKSFLAHWWGDEFGGVFIWLSKDQVKMYMDRIKEALLEYEFYNIDTNKTISTLTPTLSMWLAHCEKPDTNIEWDWIDMIKKADSNSYIAKFESKLWTSINAKIAKAVSTLKELYIYISVHIWIIDKDDFMTYPEKYLNKYPEKDLETSYYISDMKQHIKSLKKSWINMGFRKKE